MRRKGKGKPLSVVDARGGGDERRFQQWRPGAEIVEPKGRNGVHDARQQARERSVKEAVAGSNAALSAVSEDLPSESMIESWRIGEADSWGKVLVAGRGERLGNAGVTGNQQSWQCSRVERGLRTGHVGLDLIIFFPKRHDDVPAQTGVDRQVASCSPAVLRVQTGIPVAQVEWLTGGLSEVARRSQQEVGVWRTGLSAVDIEGPVERGVGMFIDLIDMELAAKLESVRAYHPGETITQIVSVVDLCLVRDRYAHHEGWEGDVLHAFKLGRLQYRCRPCRRQ